MPPAPYTMAALAEDVAALFAGLGIQRTHWVGISLGGMVGLTLALAQPRQGLHGAMAAVI